jgi:hypothetical protein
MKLVTVYRAFSPAEAQLIRSLLEASEIPAMVADELASLSTEGYSMSTGGIRVQVPEEHGEAAREIIESQDGGTEEPPASSHGAGPD